MSSSASPPNKPDQPAQERVASPCTGGCSLRVNRVCMGCGRHIDEIIEWLDATDERRRQIIESARRRRAEWGR